MQPFPKYLFSLLWISFCVGQSKITVATDKKVYNVSDTIYISVWAHNSKSVADTLRFSSSCQPSYYFGSFDFMTGLGCAAVLTQRVVPPYDSVSWTLTYPRRFLSSNDPFPTPGTHSVVGIVLEHGNSDTVFVTVTPSTSVDAHWRLPMSAELGMNFPNPFNATTVIPFSLSSSADVVLNIYDLIGRRIDTLLETALLPGTYRVPWYARNLPSGVYFCRLRINNTLHSRSMILSK